MMLKSNVPVSVVIPCYLCIDTIDRAIESILNQTVNVNEIILVEDCSPDNEKTLNHLYSIQQIHSNIFIKIVSLEENKGPGNARNIGWNLASQEYISFLDADDSWHPNKVELQYKFMKANPKVDLSASSISVISNSTSNMDEISINTVKNISFWRLLLSNVLPTPSIMLKKKINLRFDSNKKYSEDYLLWLKIAASNYKIVKIYAPLAFLYKKPYGESGLSGDLWKMEKGEINTYIMLYKEKMIHFLHLIFIIIFSISKFLIRFFIININKKLRGNKNAQ